MAQVLDEAFGKTRLQDPRQRARLRWRSRRGLLENDLILTRFLDRHEFSLTDEEVGALTELLDLSDNELLDLLLCRSELNPEQRSPSLNHVIELLRSA